jgi:iron complex transport system permease protein
MAVSLAALLALAAWSLTVGRFPVSAMDVLRAVASAITRSASGLAANVQAVVLEVRAPRVAAALVVGAALAAAGAAYQALFRNPLVSPDILGVSSGCALGAGVAVLLALPLAAVQAMAFGGGLAAVAIVVAIAGRIGERDPLLTLILAGVVVGTLFGAGIALVKIVADPYNQLPAITFWLLGSLSGIKVGDVQVVAPLVIVGLVPLALLRWRIGVLSLGDDEARALGVNVRLVRGVVIVAATLVTATAVSVSGVIGWIGLVVPHMARLLVGPRFDRLLPAAVLMGAAFLVLIDTVARSAARIEIPLGLLTALLGAPVFVWLLARGRRSWS